MATMKCLIRIAVFLALFLLPSLAANAACGAGAGTCFVVAAGGNSNATSTWTATSGGATCTCVPAASDAVILDSAAGNLTVDAAFSVASIDASGVGGSGSPYTGTMAQNASTAVTISGLTYKLVAGMGYTVASGVSSTTTFTSTSGTTAITTAGKTMGTITYNGAGGTFQLQDNMSANFNAGVVVTLTNGILDLNGRTLTAPVFSTSNSNVRSLTFGAGTLSLGGTAANANNFDASTSTNLTVNVGTGTILMNGTGSAQQTFSGGGKTYPTISFAASANMTYVMTGSGNIFGAMVVAAPANVKFGAGISQTVSGALTFTGTSTAPILLESTTSGTIAGLIYTGASTCAWCGIKDIAFNSASNFTANNSMSYGNNSISGGGALSITAPSVGGGGRIIGG